MIRSFLRYELKNWKAAEAFWLVLSTVVIFSLSIYWKDSWIGIAAALTGVWCVVLTGKGKLSSYIFGTFNVLFYSYIAFHAKYYGEVMLNMLYYFPMNFIGWFMWRKHMDEKKGEVEKKKLPLKLQGVLLLITALLILSYSFILKWLGGKLPFIDSMSTVISVVAQILCVKRYMEQWILWIIVDVVTVFMWIAAFFNGGESVATLIMWSVFLVNGVIMFIKWNKESKGSAINEV